MIVPRLYRWALNVLPRGFRRRYGNDMATMFEDTWVAGSVSDRVRVILRAVRDLTVSAIALRVRAEDDWDVPRGLNGGSARRAYGNGTGRMMMGSGGLQDLRYALKGLVARPGFAALTVLTVGLGVGASTAVFSVVDAVVFRALPYEAPDRLVSMWTVFESMGPGSFGLSDAEYIDYAKEQTSFESFGAYALGEATWRPVDSDPMRASVAYVFPGLLEVLHVTTRLGRVPTASDVEPGVPGLLLLSHDFWRTRFASSPDVIGRTMNLDGSSGEIVGVLEPGARLPDGDPGVWIVFQRDRAAITDRSGHYLSGVGRLAEGVDLEAVQAEVDAVHGRWAVEWAGVHSPGHGGHEFRAAGLEEVVLGFSRTVALALAGASGLLLLLACVNVAGLLVARGEERLPELGIRTALGAGRARLSRQLMCESLVLGVLGGLLGYALASWGTSALIALDSSSLPGLERVNADGRTFAFALIVSVATGLLFGLLPVLRIPHQGASSLLRGRGLGSVGRRETGGVLSALVLGQVALATTVVVGAGLLFRSRTELTSVDPGFEIEDALVFDLGLPGREYGDLESIDRFWASLTERLEALPGVDAAGVVRNFPLRGGGRSEYILLQGSAAERYDGPAPIVYQAVRAGTLETMGARLVEGRLLSDTDRADALYVAVVNEAAARTFWQDGAIGERFKATFAPDDNPLYTVVGVVGDMAQSRLDAVPSPQIYLSLPQTPVPGRNWVRRATVLVRGGGGTTALAPAIRRVVRELEPTVPVENLAVVADVLRGASARMRFLSLLLGVFAATALLVAAVGVYGTASFSVALRKREFGVRLALGAEPMGLMSRVLGRSLGLAVAGALVGLAGALLLGPVLASLLYGVGARDALALTGGPLAMVLTVAIAAWVPARRAARVAPVDSLRSED